MRVLFAILLLSLSVARIRADTCLTVREGQTELNKGLRLAEAYNWYDAKRHFITSLQLSKSCGDQHNALLAKIGWLRATMEQRNLAALSRELQDIINAPAVQHDAELRLWAYIAKGDVDQDLHYPSTARKDWEAVKQLAQQTRNRKWTYRADGELAIPAFYQGDVATARSLVTEAMAAAAAAHDGPSYVRLLTHIGTVYAMWGDYEHALDHLNKALTIAQHDPEQGYPVNVQEGRLMVLLGQNHLEDAEKLAKELIAIELREDRRVNEAQTMVTLGSIYRAEKRPHEAVQELSRAIRIATAGSYQQSLGNGEFALADLYRAQRNLKAAELHAARAVTATHDSGMVSELPQRMAVLAALKAEEGKWKEADSLYRRAEDEVDSQLAFAPFSARPPLLKSESDIYKGHFALVAEHSAIVEDAYRIIERVRGRSIYGLLRTGILSQSAESDAAEKEIGSLRLQLAEAKTDEQLAAIRDQIFVAAHKRWLSNEEVSALRKSPDQISPLSATQHSLQRQEVLIEYMQTSERLYAVVVTSETARILKLAKTSDVITAARSFLDAVTAQHEALREGLDLWRLLLGGISEVEAHPRLLIVPDAELYAVPFDAMASPSGQRVVENHTVIRLPSASAYVLLQKRAYRNIAGGLLAVGGVTYNKDVSAIAALRGWDGKKLLNLPATEDEVVDAEDALRGFMPTTELSRTDATEAAFKAAHLSDRKVIHLAVHGEASPDTSDRAALFFLDDPNAHEDGVLEIPEIVRLPLRAELVVLSACETAVGPSQGEDGVLGLHRAFLLAGARSVMATLWRVDDTFSEKLIRQFYAGLARGMTTSDALASAQRSVLHEFSDKAVPYYWAGFILDGADTRIVNSQKGARIN